MYTGSSEWWRVVNPYQRVPVDELPDDEPIPPRPRRLGPVPYEYASIAEPQVPPPPAAPVPPQQNPLVQQVLRERAVFNPPAQDNNSDTESDTDLQDQIAFEIDNEQVHTQCIANEGLNYDQRCRRPVYQFAPYCRHHTPVYIKQSNLAPVDDPFDGVFVRGWYDLANGYPADEPGRAQDLPLNKVIGDYIIGSDRLTRQQLDHRYPDDPVLGAQTAPYAFAFGHPNTPNEEVVFYDADGDIARQRGAKTVAAIVNDCLPVNETAGLCTGYNCRFNPHTLELVTGDHPTAPANGPGAIPKDTELYVSYGDGYWAGFPTEGNPMFSYQQYHRDDPGSPVERRRDRNILLTINEGNTPPQRGRPPGKRARRRTR